MPVQSYGTPVYGTPMMSGCASGCCGGNCGGMVQPAFNGGAVMSSGVIMGGQIINGGTVIDGGTMIDGGTIVNGGVVSGTIVEGTTAPVVEPQAETTPPVPTPDETPAVTEGDGT